MIYSSYSRSQEFYSTSIQYSQADSLVSINNVNSVAKKTCTCQIGSDSHGADRAKSQSQLISFNGLDKK